MEQLYVGPGVNANGNMTVVAYYRRLQTRKPEENIGDSSNII